MASSVKPERRRRKRVSTSELLELHYAPDQLALAFGVHKNTILSWIDEGLFGDALRKGEKFLRVPASGVNKFIREHRDSLPGA